MNSLILKVLENPVGSKVYKSWETDVNKPYLAKRQTVMSGSDYIDFEKALVVGQRYLNQPRRRVLGLYIIVSVNTGLRIGDLLRLKWKDLSEGIIEITEKKTGKKAYRKINSWIKDALGNFNNINPEDYIFKSNRGTVYSREYINTVLRNQWGISSHGLRKTFGRHVYNVAGQSEDALVKLSEMFNHSSIKVTRTYLGIRQKELDDLLDML